MNKDLLINIAVAVGIVIIIALIIAYWTLIVSVMPITYPFN